MDLAAERTLYSELVDTTLATDTRIRTAPTQLLEDNTRIQNTQLRDACGVARFTFGPQPSQAAHLASRDHASLFHRVGSVWKKVLFAAHARARGEGLCCE